MTAAMDASRLGNASSEDRSLNSQGGGFRCERDSRYFSTGRKLRTATILGLFSVAWATLSDTASAQGIEGRLLDEPTGEPISGGIVTLLDAERQSIRRSAVTDDDGTFSLRISVPGRYHLRASRIGYEEIDSPPLDVRDGEVVELELRISTEAIPLAPLTVVSDRPPLVMDDRLVRRGYYERKAMYQHLGAHFLEYEEIQERDSWSLVGVLRSLPGVRIYPAGGRDMAITDRRGRPLWVCLDGVRITRLAPDELTLDELAIPSGVVALELYPGQVRQQRYRCNLLIWTGLPPDPRDGDP